MARFRSERGQTSPEYLGVIVLVAAIIVALVGAGIPQKVASGIDAAVCKVAGQCSGEGGPGAPTSLGDQVTAPSVSTGGSPTQGETAQTSDPDDPDGDGISTDEERERGTDPNLWDSDGDGKSDYDEIRGRRRFLAQSDPLNPDSDFDGVDDGVEMELGSNPNDDDSDGDGVFDGEELSRGLDPINRDSDGDGFDDAKEVRMDAIQDVMRDYLLQMPMTRDGAVAQIDIMRELVNTYSTQDIYDAFWDAYENDDEFRDHCCQGFMLPDEKYIDDMRTVINDPTVTDSDFMTAFPMCYGELCDDGPVELLQGGLELCGFAVDLCDGANALIYAAKGDWAGAALSGVGAVPVFGSPASKGGKAAKNALEEGTERGGREAAEEALEQGAKNSFNFADEVLEHADFAADVAGTGRTITRSNSHHVLAQNMERMGLKQPADTAAHHIVAYAAGSSPAALPYLQKAADARRILDRYGVDVNSAANGAFLPRSVHRRVHTKSYYEAVTEALTEATSKDEAIEILHDIRQGLLDGSFP